MADSDLHATINDSDSDLSGTMYEHANSPTSKPTAAVNINYDNSVSGLTAENVQDAIDEIAKNGGGGGGEGGGGVTSYPLLSDKPMINGVTLNGNLSPENVGAFPMFTGAEETDPDTSLKGLMFVQCSDELKSILGMPRAYIKQYFYSTGAITNNQTRMQIAIAYGDVAKMAIRQYYGSPKAWTPWVAFSGESGTGEDGFSPIIDVIEIDGGHKVTITDANDTESFNVMDGKDGTDAEVPEALPNPYALTLTGAVSAVYNGSEAVTVEIPIGGGGGGTELDYSTVEQATGRKWIDGKPIYMKVVLGNIAATTSYQNVSHGILKSDGETGDLETLVQCDFFAITDAGRYYAVPYGSDDGKVTLKYMVTSAMFMIKNSGSTALGFQAVMYYTRKSDSAEGVTA